MTDELIDKKIDTLFGEITNLRLEFINLANKFDTFFKYEMVNMVKKHCDDHQSKCPGAKGSGNERVGIREMWVRSTLGEKIFYSVILLLILSFFWGGSAGVLAILDRLQGIQTSLRVG